MQQFCQSICCCVRFFLLFVQRSIGAVIRCNCGFSNSVERHTKKNNRMRLIDKINYNTHTHAHTHKTQSGKLKTSPLIYTHGQFIPFKLAYVVRVSVLFFIYGMRFVADIGFVIIFSLSSFDRSIFGAMRFRFSSLSIFWAFMFVWCFAVAKRHWINSQLCMFRMIKTKRKTFVVSL